ncbi:MAG: polyketide antibiotic transporter [Pseudolysinimonas sp.]
MFRILLQQARRDRITLPIWILGTVLLIVTVANTVVSEFSDAESRANILAVALATPALLALRGIPHGDSLGSALHFQSFAFLALTIGLMNVFLATRHGRADEEKGRRELVLATPVSRLTPPLATLILGVIANGIFVALAVGGYVGAGVPTDGAVLSGVTLGVTGLAFLGLAMLAGELTETSRAANGIGVVLVLGSYALRAAGDALGRADIQNLTLEPAWPSWISPIGWGQQTLAFTENRWWPVALLAGLAVVGAVVALLIHSRRDLGAGLLPERGGPATALPTLASPLALAWRLQWPTIIAWTIGSALIGFLLGQLVTAVANVSFANPQIQAILQSLAHSSDTDLSATLIGALMVIVGAVAAAAGVQAILRMREEESDGRLEAVLATPGSRAAWLLSFASVAAATVLIVLLGTGIASAIGFAILGDADSAWLAFWSALVQAPAALTFVGVTVLLFGLLPRASIGLGWGVFGVLAVIGLFGGLLGLSDDAEKISPITSVPALPTDDWVPTLIVAGVAVGTTLLGVLAFRRRDLTT